MFSVRQHKEYRANLERIAYMNRDKLRGKPFTAEQTREHESRIASWRAYEKTLNYKFFFALTRFQHSNIPKKLQDMTNRARQPLWVVTLVAFTVLMILRIILWNAHVR